MSNKNLPQYTIKKSVLFSSQIKRSIPNSMFKEFSISSSEELKNPDLVSTFAIYRWKIDKPSLFTREFSKNCSSTESLLYQLSLQSIFSSGKQIVGKMVSEWYRKKQKMLLPIVNPLPAELSFL